MSSALRIIGATRITEPRPFSGNSADKLSGGLSISNAADDAADGLASALPLVPLADTSDREFAAMLGDTAPTEGVDRAGVGLAPGGDQSWPAATGAPTKDAPLAGAQGLSAAVKGLGGKAPQSTDAAPMQGAAALADFSDVVRQTERPIDSDGEATQREIAKRISQAAVPAEGSVVSLPMTDPTGVLLPQTAVRSTEPMTELPAPPISAVADSRHSGVGGVYLDAIGTKGVQTAVPGLNRGQFWLPFEQQEPATAALGGAGSGPTDQAIGDDVAANSAIDGGQGGRIIASLPQAAAEELANIAPVADRDATTVGPVASRTAKSFAALSEPDTVAITRPDTTLVSETSRSLEILPDPEARNGVSETGLKPIMTQPSATAVHLVDGAVGSYHGTTPGIAVDSGNALPTAAISPTSEPSATSLTDQLLYHVMAGADAGGRDVVLRLHPPELGDLTVRVLVDGREVSAWFASPHAEVQQAITQAIGQLHTGLGNAGYHLNNAWVGADSWSARERDRQSSMPSSRRDAADSSGPIASSDGPPPVAASRLSVYV